MKFIRNWWRVDPGGLVLAVTLPAALFVGLAAGAFIKWALS